MKTKEVQQIADNQFYFELEQKFLDGYNPTQKEMQRIYNIRKKWYIESLSGCIIPDNAPKGELFTDYIENGYYQNHEGLVEFMKKQEVYDYAKKNFNENVEGRLDIYVKLTDSGYAIFFSCFEPCRIIRKYWGTPHKNAENRKMIPIRCMYENDYTLFRASYLD